MGDGDDHVTLITGCDVGTDISISKTQVVAGSAECSDNGTMECGDVNENEGPQQNGGPHKNENEGPQQNEGPHKNENEGPHKNENGGPHISEYEGLHQQESPVVYHHHHHHEEDDDDDKDYICDFLDKSNDHAEARLAARRQARAEAREIRMRELERQQKEIEEHDMYTEPLARPTRVSVVATTSAASVSPRLNASATLAANNSYHSSRRSSEDSLEEVGNIRDIRLELKEVEEKFRKAMIQNAQLDNEKASLNYQVELMKDRLEDLDEAHSQLQREHREECRHHGQLKRAHAQLSEEATWARAQLEERDTLIGNYGLQIVGGDDGEKRALVTADNATMLYSAGSGSLDVRLRRLAEDRDDLADQVRRLQLELEEGRSQKRAGSQGGGVPTVNGGVGLADVEEAQRETNKLLADYRFKLQKAEQDVATLQASVARLESQVVRYKGASESSEKVEDELKVEKRKLQRELREAQVRVEELETTNLHYQRRFDKLKNAKSTLLKEL